MSRTRISLPAELHRRAGRKAIGLGLSLAEYVRRLIQRDLGEPEVVAEPSAVFDLGSSGASDVARDEDRLVGESVDAGRTTRPAPARRARRRARGR